MVPSLSFSHSHVYTLERSQHKVPEEALKHERYTSQLQMGLKASEGQRRDHSHEKGGRGNALKSKSDKVERKILPEAPISRPTPLYGQPSWWGEDDAGNKGTPAEGSRHDERLSENLKDSSKHQLEINGSLSDYRDSQSKSIYSYRREPSYFEIPTKEFHVHPKPSESEVHEIPTKDTSAPPQPDPMTPTPPVVQSHASFTIEFDDCTPGKIKIKDHITKFSFRKRRTTKEKATTPNEVMSAESKVADWLAHSDVSVMQTKALSDDVYSTKSDLPVHIKTLKGHHHDDGTLSDFDDPILKEKRDRLHPAIPAAQSRLQPIKSLKPVPTKARKELLSGSPPRAVFPAQPQSKPDPQQAFIIEFSDGHPRKKRSQSFSQNLANADSSSTLKAKIEKQQSVTPSEEKGAGSAGHIPPTQQLILPLKGQGPCGAQRATPLKREKTEDRLRTSTSSASLSSRSSSKITIRPFGSLGKKSKLAQEFAAEFLRDSGHSISPSRERMSPPTVMVESPYCSHLGPSCSPPLPSSPTQPALPTCLSQPPMSCSQPVDLTIVELKTPKTLKNEEEDSLSDAGTYTIEAESQDKEVEVARTMIDQVFGVLECPENAGVTAASNRPVIKDDSDGQASLRISKGSSVDRKAAPVQGYNPVALSGTLTSPVQVQPVSPGLLGGPKWVSRWASLADGYGDLEPDEGLVKSQPCPERCKRDGGITHQAVQNQNLESTEWEGNLGSRTRRLLPQVPPKDKAELATPIILIQPDTDKGCTEASRRASGAICQQESPQRLSVQDDLDPDSLSDASKSDDGSIVDRTRKHRGQQVEGRAEMSGQAVTRPTSFYIGSDETPSISPQARSPDLSYVESGLKIPPKTSPTKILTRHLSNHESQKLVQQNTSAHSPQSRDKDLLATNESPSPFVRQESFTKDHHSNGFPVKKLPQISSHPVLRDMDFGDLDKGDYGHDTQSFLKETEDALAALEAKFQAQDQGQVQRQEGFSAPIEDSLSGDSDVDTSSTVSLVSSQNDPNMASKKHTVSGGQPKEKKSSSSLFAQDQSGKTAARDRLSEKRRSLGSEGSIKAEPVKHFQMPRSTGGRRSLDLSDEPNLQQWPDTVSSDHESSSRPTSRKQIIPLQKEDSGKSSRKANQSLARSHSLSAPRPTRASMLRRAHGKKLSRLDILALPRKRSGSFSIPSDTESSAGRTGFSNRSSESSSSVRKASVPDLKSAVRRNSATGLKQQVGRTRVSGAKYASSTASSRRRQKGSDYTSTSDEEYDSHQSTQKQKRSQTSAATQTSSRAPAVARSRSKTRSRESEDDCDNKGGDPFQNWTCHSAEIARLSQDLAKDLAILAREIHDVAGDGDAGEAQPHSGVVEMLPSTPASTISAREELVQHIPEASLNYQKVPPGATAIKDPEESTNDQDPKRRVWNREEVIFDNLMLNPVSQLSQAIRENTEQLADKMKVLFHNKAELWEEVEAKVNAENEVPILKTSNKEISSILKELRRVQKQLEVINMIIEPTATLEPAEKTFATAAEPSGGRKPGAPSGDSKPSSQALGPSKNGGCPSPSPSSRLGSSANELAERPAVGSAREDFVL
ncbi:hypothetical protein GJAV_G00012340 [Gymnothorax javanicus]|nr:hypothetical protein GJAV_G00012340 [Gymnothorax javanicus]